MAPNDDERRSAGYHADEHGAAVYSDVVPFMDSLTRSLAHCPASNNVKRLPSCMVKVDGAVSEKRPHRRDILLSP